MRAGLDKKQCWHRNQEEIMKNASAELAQCLQDNRKGLTKDVVAEMLRILPLLLLPLGRGEIAIGKHLFYLPGDAQPCLCRNQLGMGVMTVVLKTYKGLLLCVVLPKL